MLPKFLILSLATTVPAWTIRFFEGNGCSVLDASPTGDGNQGCTAIGTEVDELQAIGLNPDFGDCTVTVWDSQNCGTPDEALGSFFYGGDGDQECFTVDFPIFGYEVTDC